MAILWKSDRYGMLMGFNKGVFAFDYTVNYLYISSVIDQMFMFIFILWQWLTKYKNDTKYLIVQTQKFNCSPLTHRMYFLFWQNNDSLHQVLCKYSMHAISSGLPMNIHFWWMMGYIFSTVENLLMIDKLAN